jgi:conjugal transfer pilin signal peptidase TrbI
MNGREAFLRKALLLSAAVFLLAALTAPLVREARWGVRYDPQVSGCLPWGLYAVRMGAITTPKVGELVVLRQADLEKAATLEFSQIKQGPLQEIPPAVKYVAAVAGDRVAVRGDAIWVNGRYAGKLWLKAWAMRNYPELSTVWKTGETVVPNGKILVLGSQPLAFDGRYFGLVPVTDITGRAWPI